MRVTLLGLLASLLAVQLVSSAAAYNLFGPYPWGDEDEYYQKWGDIFTTGVSPGAITWSFMPDGTSLDESVPDYIHGTSDLTSVFNQVGGQEAAIAMIQSALDHWSAVSNLQFVYMGIDDGTPFGSPKAPGQMIGDIRIGAFEIDGFSAGVGYSPYPIGDSTLDGDIILNNRSDITFYVAPGDEGELYDLYPPGGGLYRNDFEGLVAHELGHALGLAHSDIPTGLMCGFVDGDFDGSQCGYYDPDADGKAPINRIPDADDVAGIQFLYGPAPAESADFDFDGDVDGRDFLVWQRGDSPNSLSPEDLAIWQEQYGSDGLTGSVTSRAIPEPAVGTFGIMFVLFAGGLRFPGQDRPRGESLAGLIPG